MRKIQRQTSRGTRNLQVKDPVAVEKAENRRRGKKCERIRAEGEEGRASGLSRTAPCCRCNEQPGDCRRRPVTSRQSRRSCETISRRPGGEKEGGGEG